MGNSWKYAIPVAGQIAYQFDRYKDNKQKEADFRKNTGKTSKYGTDSYESASYNALGSAINSTLNAVGSTFRKLI